MGTVAKRAWRPRQDGPAASRRGKSFDRSKCSVMFDDFSQILSMNMSCVRMFLIFSNFFWGGSDDFPVSTVEQGVFG